MEFSKRDKNSSGQGGFEVVKREEKWEEKQFPISALSVIQEVPTTFGRQAEAITSKQEGSLVQNSSNLKGVGRWELLEEVLRSRALWSEAWAGRCCTENKGNRWIHWVEATLQSSLFSN